MRRKKMRQQKMKAFSKLNCTENYDTIKMCESPHPPTAARLIYNHFIPQGFFFYIRLTYLLDFENTYLKDIR
jgi:hypothetical protein